MQRFNQKQTTNTTQTTKQVIRERSPKRENKTQLSEIKKRPVAQKLDRKNTIKVDEETFYAMKTPIDWQTLADISDAVESTADLELVARLYESAYEYAASCNHSTRAYRKIHRTLIAEILLIATAGADKAIDRRDLSNPESTSSEPTSEEETWSKLKEIGVPEDEEISLASIEAHINWMINSDNRFFRAYARMCLRGNKAQKAAALNTFVANTELSRSGAKKGSKPNGLATQKSKSKDLQAAVANAQDKKAARAAFFKESAKKREGQMSLDKKKVREENLEAKVKKLNSFTPLFNEELTITQLVAFRALNPTQTQVYEVVETGCNFYDSNLKREDEVSWANEFMLFTESILNDNLPVCDDLIPLYSYFWFTSTEDMNRAVHALNGNIDYVDGDVTLSTLTGAAPGTNTIVELYRNNTNHTVCWNSVRFSEGLTVVTSPLGVNISACLQVTRIATAPTAINLGNLVNNENHRYYGYHYINVATSIGVTTRVNNVTISGDIPVAPGHILYYCTFMPVIAGIGLVSIDLNLTLLGARSSPINNVFTRNKIETVYVRVNGKYRPITATKDDGIVALKKMVNDMDAYIRYKGKIVSPDDAWGDGNWIELYGRIRGGSNELVGNVLPITVDHPSGQPETPSFKSANKALMYARDQYLKYIHSDEGDHLLGGTINNLATAANIWAAQAKPDQLLDGNIGRQICNRFIPQWSADFPVMVNDNVEGYSKLFESYDKAKAEIIVEWMALYDSINTPPLCIADERDPRYSEALVAEAQFLEDKMAALQEFERTKLTTFRPWFNKDLVFDDKGLAPMNVEIVRANCITQSLPANVNAAFSKPWASLSTAIASGDTVTLSQYIRINTSMINGDAMNRVLAVNGPIYESGCAGSFSAPLLKMFLLANGLVPVKGPEFATASANNLLASSAFNQSLDVTFAKWGRDRFPLSKVPPRFTNVVGRIIDMNTFSALRAGVGASIIIPQDWAMDQWGKTVAVVGITTDGNNVPEANAVWTLSHLEYPYKVKGSLCSVKDAGGNTYYPNATSVGLGHHTYVPGPNEKVLYVIANGFEVRGSTLTVTVGSFSGPTVVLDTVTNGLSGVNADLTPALDHLFSSAYPTNALLTHIDMAMNRWHRYFGNKPDFVSALLAATNSCYMFSPLPVHSGVTGLNLIPSSGGPSPMLGTTTWNTQLATSFASDSSAPDCLFSPISDGLASPDTIRGMLAHQPARLIGAQNPIASVDVMWGVLEFVNKDYHFPASALHAVSRMRNLAQNIGVATDLMYMATGVSLGELTSPAFLDLPGSVGGAFVRDIHDKVAQAMLKYYDVYSDEKYRVPYKIVPNIWSQQQSWTYYQRLNINIANYICYARTPLSNNYVVGPSFQLPANFDIAKAQGDSTIVRYPDDRSLDILNYAYNTIDSDTADFWKDFCSMMTAVPPRDNAIAAGMYLTNPTGAILQQLWFPIVSADASRAFATQWASSGITGAQNPLLYDQIDPVVFPSLPTFSPLRMLHLFIGFLNDSQFFATVSRIKTVQYNKRVHVTDYTNYSTLDVGDGIKASTCDFASKLGF